MPLNDRKVHTIEPLRPSRIGLHLRELLVHKAAELIDPEMGDEELDARLVPIPLFSESRVHACDRLRNGEHLLFGHILIEDLGHMRNGAKSTADDDTESALLLPILLAHLGDKAQIVHHDAGAPVVGTSGVSDLELPTEVLNIPMSE
jgi:hypothetical protein